MRRIQERKELPKPLPDTNTDLLDCTEEEWAAYIKEQEAKLMEKAAKPACASGSQVASSALSSTINGVEACSTVMTMTKVGSNFSQRTRNPGLCPAFEMNVPDNSWRVPIIDSRVQIQDIVEGKLCYRSVLELIIQFSCSGNQIVVLSGPTGCGKSTQVPQYILYQHAMQKKYVNIVVTQPRKLAASSLARRVCEERNWELGGMVGYQVKSGSYDSVQALISCIGRA